MKNLTILLLMMLIGCSKENNSNIISNPSAEITLNIEKSNSENNYLSKAKNVFNINKSSKWVGSSDTLSQPNDSVFISRGKRFRLELENGDTIEIEISFQKRELKELLYLKDNVLPVYLREWDYKRFEDEESLFYKNFDEARIDFGSNGLYFLKQNENFKIVNVQKAFETGLEKSYIEINFSGIAYGWYDPRGEFAPVYTITNGHFKGILE
ncbi:MAG: hypothetical protein WC384_14180 [Prolixibacteraceae bacterium]|jgi:hypothetical protein